MALNNTKALPLQKFDASYTQYVTMYRTYDSVKNSNVYKTEMITVIMKKLYNFYLRLLSSMVILQTIDAPPKAQSLIMKSEPKDWKVYFNFVNADGTTCEKREAFFVDGSWVSHEMILPNTLGNDQITIQCTINFNANAINYDSRKISSTPPKFQALDDVIGHSFEEQKFTDVTINVCGKELRAHKVILAARSSVFSAMFENEMSEQIQNKVDIIDMDFEVIREMLRFIYTGKAPNITEKTSELLAAADKYDLQRLKVMCEEEIAKSIVVENVAEILKVADLHNAELLKTTAIDFITSNAEDVIETAEYQSMIPTHPHLILEMLRSFVINLKK